jgi:hypothetical protein
VDMSTEAVSPDGVHIAGSFNGFSPSASQMSVLSPGLYSFTASVDPNTQITYKFINGNDWPFAETVPFECGVDDGFGGYNRAITVGEQDVVVNAVCFSSCAACPVGIQVPESGAFAVYPNPSSEKVMVATGRLNESLFTVTDCTGRLIAAVPCEGREICTLNVDDWSPGIYYIRFAKSGLSSALIVH